MAEEVFTAGSPEVDVNSSRKSLVMQEGERGKIGTVVLTNDRMLFTQQKFDSGVGGGALGALVAEGLQKRSEKKSGGPRELFSLSEVQGIKKVRRRMRGDIYEFTLIDGTTCAVDAKAMKGWNETVLRLLAERHGRTVSEVGEDAWQVA